MAQAAPARSRPEPRPEPRSETRAPITVLLPAKSRRLERRLALTITIIPFLGFCVAVPLLWGTGISGVDLAIMVTLYCVSGLGVTLGFHRMLTHRSFDSGPVLRVILAVAGSLAVEGSVIRWVADHRRHHAFTDRPGDPHSPHLEEAEGVAGVLKGLWHAHIGWFFASDEVTNIEHFAPDLLKDRGLRVVDKLFPLWVVISFALPALLGLVITRSLTGAFTALVWGGLVRMFILHHVTWSTNSICHFYGKRPFDSRDLSTNNWLLSLVSFGEAWHNNHHAFPTSAKHGLEPWQVDLTAWLVAGLERLGLVWNVRRPSLEQLQSKRV